MISNSCYHLYADDLQLYRSSFLGAQSIDECVNSMNADLKRIEEWACNNGLRLNTAKTQSIVVYKSIIDAGNFQNLSLGNSIIPYSLHVKSLGTWISQDLKWDKHIDQTCCKIFNTLKVLWKTTQFAGAGLRRKLFSSYVFPHFVYADLIYYGMSDRCFRKLNRCFNACVRYIFRLRKYDHISSFTNRLIGCSLSLHRDFRACWFFKQLLKTESPEYLHNKLGFSFNFSSNLRLTLRHNISHCNNSSIFVKGVRLWNSLPLHIRRTESRSVFLERLLEWRRGSVFVA